MKGQVKPGIQQQYFSGIFMDPADVFTGRKGAESYLEF